MQRNILLKTNMLRSAKKLAEKTTLCTGHRTQMIASPAREKHTVTTPEIESHRQHSTAPMAQQQSAEGTAEPVNVLKENVTTSFGDFVAGASLSDISGTVLKRSKRMMLDSLGVGLIGSTTEIARTAVEHAALLGGGGQSQLGSACTLWGRSQPSPPRSSLIGATFANGVMTHAMDFDDTWHPATHPSGPVLPAILALAEAMPGKYRVSGADILLAYNIGIEVQGLLLRFSQNAQQIPNRFHPPAVVGVMGSAAACAKLLGLDAERCRHALAIAASFAGAPMANAGTKAKPLHAGNSARFGLEAALLADAGVRGSDQIMDNQAGFGAYFRDYNPISVKDAQETRGGWSLDIQDIAFKRIPAHLSMHWASDAAAQVRRHIVRGEGPLSVDDIREIVVDAPNSKYVNRPLPVDEHAARHSFQFNTCVTLLDGMVQPSSFSDDMIQRPALRRLLDLTRVVTPADNDPNFDRMYVRVGVETRDGSSYTAKCTTPYGHWRLPLSDADLQKKFSANAQAGGLSSRQVANCIDMIQRMDEVDRHTLPELFTQLD